LAEVSGAAASKFLEFPYIEFTETSDQPVAESYHSVKRLLLAGLVVVSVLAPAACGQAPRPATENDTGTRIVIGRSLSFKSTVLDRTVTLDVALPAGYATAQERYPVLLAFQNQLPPVYGVVEAMSRAAAVPPMIVVAVGVPGDMFELHARDGAPGPGRAARVLEFLRVELEPFIDARYRTVPYRIVLGHSASALFGIWAALAAPDAIHAVLAAGPMFPDYDYGRVAAMLEASIASRPARPQFLFFTQGNQPELTRDLAAFRRLLRRCKPDGLTYEFDPEPMSNHNSLGIRTLHDGLWRLYLGWSTLPEPIAAAGAPAIRAHKKALAARFGYDIGLSRLADNQVRARWTAKGLLDKVIALALFGCEEWPADHWRVQQLALAYEQAGRWREARPPGKPPWAWRKHTRPTRNGRRP
jgi:predicted alpha/beta superfamily hydrolase